MVDVQRKYGSRVRVKFDQDDCTFYLESLTSDFTAADLVKEFGLTPIREYFTRYRKVRAKFAK
jgi:hypothetical protein